MRWLSAFLFAAVLVLVLFAVLVWSPLLRVRSIDISGQANYSRDEIQKAAGIKLGSHPIFPVQWEASLLPNTSLDQARISIEELPWVLSAQVEWIPLHLVRIQIEEREAFARLPYLGGYLLLDTEGVVLDVLGNEEKLEVKELRGIRISGYVKGNKPDVVDVERLNKGMKVLEAFSLSNKFADQNLYDYLSWVDILSDDRVLVYLDERITLRLNPKADLSYIADFAHEIFFGHIKPEEKGIIDFAQGKDPAFIPH